MTEDIATLAMTEYEINGVSDHGASSTRSAPNGDTNILHQFCLEVRRSIDAFLQKDFTEETLRSVQGQCRNSIATIREAVDRYPLDVLSLSYNGGKDCLVLLVLYLAVLSEIDHLPSSLPAIYIQSAHPFAEVESFVASSSAHYHLTLSCHHTPRNSMKDAFASYLSSPAGKPIKAVFVGTRRTDPHGGNLSPFDMTDRGWPSFMRVHPVLEWKYVEIWAFLRYFGTEWCPLYDHGFTSLGGMKDTHPNPKLKYEDEDGRERYKPAWVLTEDEDERLGRD